MGSAPLELLLPELMQSGTEGVLVFEDETGRQIDFDFRGTAEEVVARAVPGVRRQGPGRPKLGVVSREISLLPRHWQWLELQPRGASAALRKLVDAAIAGDGGAAALQQGIEATGRVLTAVGGNLPGFEEALRALYAKRFEDAQRIVDAWPGGLGEYVRRRLAVVAGVS